MRARTHESSGGGVLVLGSAVASADSRPFRWRPWRFVCLCACVCQSDVPPAMYPPLVVPEFSCTDEHKALASRLVALGQQSRAKGIKAIVQVGDVSHRHSLGPQAVLARLLGQLSAQALGGGMDWVCTRLHHDGCCGRTPHATT